MDSGFNLIFDVIEILAGGYIIYAGINMKKTGTLPAQLVGKDVDLVHAPDPDGFIRSMFIPYMICGAVFLILGGLSLYTDKFSPLPLKVNLTVTGVLFVNCVIFAFLTRKAQDKYLT